MSTELATLNELFTKGDVAVQSVEDLKALDKLSKSTTYLPRLVFYGKTKSGPTGTIIEGGHYGAPRSGEEIDDLGASVDVLIFARKPKAVDMSDLDNIIVSTDPASEEFQRIENEADNVQDSGCVYGPCYLVYERRTKKFYEFLCGTKSARYESSKINGYLPIDKQMIDGGFTDEKKTRGPKPVTLSNKYLERGRWSWYAPKADDCLTPFETLPTSEELQEELGRFFKKNDTEVEVVKEDTKKRKR